MAYYGLDYVAQIGTAAILLVIAAVMCWLWQRLLNPIVERQGMVERVKMALYDKELQAFCVENKVDYSKIDINLGACYKKKHGKLKQRLEEIEKELL